MEEKIKEAIKEPLEKENIDLLDVGSKGVSEDEN